MRCSVGKTWNSEREACTGSAKRYKWQAALDYAKTVSFANHSDWRLPTIDELHTIVMCSSGKRRDIKRENGKTIKVNGEYQDGRCLGSYNYPTINTKVFPDTAAGYFWSSSPHSNYSDYAWIILFVNGYGSYSYRGSSYRLRLVRSGQ